MSSPAGGGAAPSLASELIARHQGLPQLWGWQGFWQIRLRWAVAPLMIFAVVVARLLGFEFRLLPILAIALASPLYNALFAFLISRYRDRLESDPRLDRLFTGTEVVADYTAMFLLIYFTGGVSSPLVLFLLFHVIIAAIQFTAAAAYALAGVAAGGLWLLLAGQLGGWLPCHHVTFRGTPVHYMDRPVYAVVMLLVFTATLFITAGMVSRISEHLRQRVAELARASADLASANERLRSLYRMLAAIGAERRMEPLLASVTAELAKVTGAPAVAVKLLSDDGRELRYVAAHGLPERLIEEKIIDLERSPVNRRVIEEEALVEVPVDRGDALMLGRELAELGFRFAVLAPLKVEQRVIGTLSFYQRAAAPPDRRDDGFLRLAAELVAIAIDHARSHEAVSALVEERTQFMLEVAHNLRAPLVAGLGIVDLLAGGYAGELSAPQRQHLERLDARLRALSQTIGELLAVARVRDRSVEIEDVVVDLAALARHTVALFRAEAERRSLALELTLGDDLPPVASGVGLLEQLLENLLSNAVKYTPDGGTVELRVERDGPLAVRLTVRDTGIGIPAAEQDRLFREFFRASNARKRTPEGTGLGLVLVKQTVARHGGTLELSSEEGDGTTVTVRLPTRAAAAPPA